MNSLIKILSVLMLSLALPVSGCWDRKELDQLAIVSSIAYDTAAEPEGITVTAQLILSGKVSAPGTGGGGGEKTPVRVIQATATTPFAAVRNMSLQSEEKPYFSHNPILVMGRGIAEKGVSPILDFHFRDPEHRRTGYFLVAEGKGQDIIAIGTEQEEIPGMFIKNMLETANFNTSKIALITEQEFMERLMSKTTSPYATLIKTSEDGKEKTLRLTGTAVFKRDKLAGKFDYRESRGLLWILGKVKSGIIVVPCSEHNGEIGLEIIRAKSKIIPEITENSIKITIKVSEEGNLGDQSCSEDLTTPAAWQELEKKQAAAIKEEMMAAVAKSRELNSDVFGFGDAVHRKYPQLWRDELEENWDDYYPELEIEIIVEARLRRPGMITKPAVPQ
ncbi:MAG: Ger(x)C family spore germination protein [Peptococcaceae bacterium]